MSSTIKTSWFLLLFVLCTAATFYGCEGSEPREKVTETVKELSGQKDLERMAQMKKDIGVIRNRKEDWTKQIGKSTD